MDRRGEHEYVETLVVGGGQAGLSVGYHLARRGLPFVILEANERLGDSWRKRWDSLRLFTPCRYSTLDGMAFPWSAARSSHEGRGRRLPRGLRCTVRVAGSDRHQG